MFSHLCDLMPYLSSLYVDNHVQIYCEHRQGGITPIYSVLSNFYTLKMDSYLTVNRFIKEMWNF